MTSTITGLPDRYRPLDEIGPEERTDSGVIHSWRAKDRILNRDVAIRVHVPGGPSARAWIARALTAGGLATPALAMVYDASEGTGGEAGVAYVVNEWIDGQTLAERLESGPMDERQARTVLRRLAEGVAEAHRVGLAVGGLGPETVVLRPNGLVGLRAVPAAAGSVQEDIAALGALLEYCLTGRTSEGPGPAPVIAAPDLAALVRRARSTEPGARLASAAAMAALLAERPRSHSSVPVRDRDESDSGWLRRLREHREAEQSGARPDATQAVAPVGGAPHRFVPGTLPPVPPAPAPQQAEPQHAESEDAWLEDDRRDDVWDDDVLAGDDHDDEDDEPRSSTSRRLLVIGLPLAALVVVVLLALWVGNNLLSVSGEVDSPGTTPPAPTSSAPAEDSAAPTSAAAGPVTLAGGAVFDPFGDGEPENDDEVPASFDGDPATTWSTLNYRGSADFGNLKPGVGVVYDLGSAQAVGGVTLTTSTPGIVVEVRTGDAPDGELDSFAVAAAGTVDGTAELAFEEPVTTQYVLVWVTGLVPAEDGFAGTLAEVAVTPAG
ncbi:protein kinase family protein [Geodermatophilus sp. FMUSA9-8]|uniref:protein kinase family protein n=1 Tax=Geodermatophilus sp. FMUSA9-8 TaxID=3120155 RepID=UPI00300BB82F